MKSIVTPVKIINRTGCQLFGMLHEPEERRDAPTIILLSPGIKSRVAPHRLYIKMSKLFCEMGFTVLRVDPEGLGDSEGEINERFAADVYGSMELGRLVNDTIDVMDWVQSNFGINRFILSGLCGGAITGLLTGAVDKRVVSLLALGMTCIVSGSKIDHSEYITRGELESLRRSYFRKIFNFSSIIRLLTLRTDYRLLIKSTLQPLHCWMDRWNHKAAKCTVATAALREDVSNLNPQFPKAFLSFARERKILLIFSGEDRLYWEYEEKFMKIYEESVTKYIMNLRTHIVKNANHIFSFSEWQEEMLDISRKWLNEYCQEKSE